MKRILPLLISLLSSFLVFAQDTTESTEETTHQSPTLQVGLGGISFTKGTLDPVIIAELIARKQKELKTRTIKYMLLEQLKFPCNLYYSYIDNTIDQVTRESNDEARLKILLENTVNIAFVTAFAEFYLQTIPRPNDSIRRVIQNYEEQKLERNTNINNEKEYKILSDRYREAKDIERLLNVYNIKSPDLTSHYSLFKLAELKETPSKGAYKYSDDGNAGNKLELVAMLIDAAAEVVKENEQLQHMGILRNNYLQNFNGNFKEAFNDRKRRIEGPINFNKLNSLDTLVRKIFYDTLNTAQAFDNVSNASTKTRLKVAISAYRNTLREKYPPDTDTCKDARFEQYFDNGEYQNLKDYFFYLSRIRRPEYYVGWIQNDMRIFLDTYLKYAGLIKTLVDNKTFKDKPINEALNEVLKQYNAVNGCTDDFNKLLTTYEQLSKGVKNKKSLEILNSFFTRGKLCTDEKANLSQTINLWEASVKQAFNELATENTGFVELRERTYAYLLCNFKQVDEDLAKMHITSANPFLQLLSKTSNFDKPETYTAFIDYLANISDLFPNETTRFALNLTTKLLRSSIKLTKDSKNHTAIEMNIESFILQLQDIPRKKWFPLDIHFTVGLNHATFFGPTANLLRNKDNKPIYNYSFFSEKIGFKLKIWDWKYTRTQPKGAVFKYWGVEFKRLGPPREPIISNVHMLFYGSGVLYNILPYSGTTKGFNAPIVAAGLGVTFFNGLDANVSFGFPIQKDKRFDIKTTPGILNVGLDVQFVEYIQEANKKIKDNKNKKLLLQAQQKQ